ncbi:hypothetical protein HWD35_16270 [Tsukamurella tyrosinosolvens]|uniref:hypothetical protein n=1 Tax=Tsukamurella tyrosinosolvens TaxID=57704 RepID=UPI001CE19F69|nr:hypothetical protein [Tsukamurella tyrosinosolvens]MCA4996275.1 hypothetical protein [Tsukamurella tyrosinosolvens]
MNDWQRVSDKLGGISRSLVFSLWKSGDLASVRIGTRRFSTDRQLADYVSRLESSAA